MKCGPPMRKFGIKYAQSHPQAELVREAFVRVRSADEIDGVLSQWYADDRPGRYPPPPDETAAQTCEDAA
jgi:hypothetical protein